MKELPNTCRQFLSPSGTSVYTVIPDGHGTYSVVEHTTYSEIHTVSGLSEIQLGEIYNIQL